MSGSSGGCLHSTPAVTVTGVIEAIVSAAAGRLQIVRCSVRSGFLLIFIFGVAPLFAQAPEHPNPQGVIRITVNLVQVDAVVTDSKGRPVTNLRPEDFEILEDGRPQTITNFSYISVTGRCRGESAAQPPPPGVPSVPPARLRPEQVRRTIAIVVDDFHIRFGNIVYARHALEKFVDEDVQPGDLVAILRTSGGLGVLQQFTNDKRLLYAAIDRICYVVDSPCGLFGLQSDLPLPLRRYCDQITNAATFNALDYVVRGLRDLPGRKALILASDEILPPPREPTVQQRRPVPGNPGDRSSRDNISVPRGEETPVQRMQELVDLANRSSTVIYTIDTRGLPTLQLSAADDLTGLQPIEGGPPSVGPQPSQVASALMNRIGEYLGSMGAMAYLANQTGGIFVHDNNDLAGGMREVMDDLGGYYLIGFKPPADTFKAGKKWAGYHRLQVKVKVPGLRVRSRSGFYGIPDEETRPAYRTRDEQLRDALTSPFGTWGVHVQLASQFVNEGRNDSLVRLWLHIDARDLTLQDGPDGTKKGAIDIVGAAFGDNGAPVSGLDRTFRVSFQPSQLDALRKWGVNYRMDVPIKDPGAYQLRVAVGDSISQSDSISPRVGSASHFTEIPDLRRGRLTLSGIVLNPDTLGDKGPAVRRFQVGDRVSYELEIYNARRGTAGKPPDLESTIQILLDGHLVSTQNPGAISQVPWDSRRLVMSGELTLGPDMLPGDYALQVTVTDKLAARQYSVASQWIDFEIVQ